MTRGDVPVSPWFRAFPDYLGRAITITINYNDATKAIGTTVIHRDPGCLWTRIVWDDPSNAAKAKRSPSVPEGDSTLTANQLRQATGFQTITEVEAVQITAEP